MLKIVIVSLVLLVVGLFVLQQVDPKVSHEGGESVSSLIEKNKIKIIIKFFWKRKKDNIIIDNIILYIWLFLKENSWFKNKLNILEPSNGKIGSKLNNRIYKLYS